MSSKIPQKLKNLLKKFHLKFHTLLPMRIRAIPNHFIETRIEDEMPLNRPIRVPIAGQFLHKILPQFRRRLTQKVQHHQRFHLRQVEIFDRQNGGRRLRMSHHIAGAGEHETAMPRGHRIRM